jgi:fructose-specific phosphotransferase system IIC component
MLGGVGDHAPHGGPVVLPVVDHRGAYLAAILAGTIVTSLAISLLKSMRAKQPGDQVTTEVV